MDDCEYTELTCSDLMMGFEALFAAAFIKNDDGGYSIRIVDCNA